MLKAWATFLWPYSLHVSRYCPTGWGWLTNVSFLTSPKLACHISKLSSFLNRSPHSLRFFQDPNFTGLPFLSALPQSPWRFIHPTIQVFFFFFLVFLIFVISFCFCLIFDFSVWVPRKGKQRKKRVRLEFWSLSKAIWACWVLWLCCLWRDIWC